MKIHNIELGILALLLTLAACAAVDGGESAEEPAADEPEVTTLIYAVLTPEDINIESIKRFNREHKDVQIEARNYARLSENGKSGVDLLMVELATGQVPDIFDFGSSGQLCQLSYRELAKKGFLEELWPYILNDPDTRNGELIMQSFLKPAEVDGGLYTIYGGVYIQTLMGAESVVGDRYSWTVGDMLEAFEAMPNGEAIWDNVTGYSVTPSLKRYLLSSYMTGFIDLFIDWDNGQCFFDGPQFRELLELINSLPDTPQESDWMSECKTLDEINAMHELRLRKGETMLFFERLNDLINPRIAKVFFGEPSVPAGYPLGDGTVGSYYVPGTNMLAMSSTCKDKDAAWEYMRQMIVDRNQKHTYSYGGLPVSRPLFNLQAKSSWYSTKWNVAVANDIVIPLEKEYSEGLYQLEDYFDTITHCSLFLEPSVLEFILEEASAYFAGDLTLDQTAGRIQSRATLYVNERM